MAATLSLCKYRHSAGKGLSGFCPFCLAISLVATQQPEAGFHSLRQVENMGTPGVSASSKASHRAHHRGLRNPCSLIYPRCLGFSFSHRILLGPNSRLVLMGPHHPSSPWRRLHGCSPLAVSYPHSWVWPPYSQPTWSIFAVSGGERKI